MASEPTPAATVAVIRRETGRPAEVFMVRRVKRMAFMGGAFVFPGGKLDEEDLDPAWRELSAPFDLPGRAGRMSVGEDLCLALHVSAIRETFEEVGLLYASPADKPGELAITGGDPLAAARERLNAGAVSFAEIVREGGLLLRPDLLYPFDHWITPEMERLRFDAFFFVARAPGGQTAAHEAGESIEGGWFAPEDVIGRYLKKKLWIAPPTYVTLERLAARPEVEEAIETLAARPIVANCPKLGAHQGGQVLFLPGDPRYGSYEGERTEDTPVRVRIDGGMWRMEYE